jgi:hypothetical protein
MGNRYWITGVQVGILMSEINKEIKMNILNQVIENQQLEDMEVCI